MFSRKAPRYIANFDSTSAMVRALMLYLKGKDFPGLGIAPRALKPLAMGVNKLPQPVREFLYTWGGWGEAIRARDVKNVDAEVLAEWVCSLYPQRKYPAIAIGSAGGALMHLCAALGIPFLPQTFLIPVRRHGVHPDEPKQDLEWGDGPGWDLLEANPQVQLHHMNDANQDPLMIKHMSYFRIKRLWLGQAYEQFIRNHLEEGGTLILSECLLTWPTIQVRDRHIFQHGAIGGATPAEFLRGSNRVAQYLERYGSHTRQWDSPTEGHPTTADRPEAEWGFEPALGEDVERFAARNDYRVRRMLYKEPEHLSPLVADLYRWWYRQRRLPTSRLLVGSFLVSEPWWTLQTGSAPYWMTFNKEPSAAALEQYIDHAGGFDEIYLMLFSHGVDSVGIIPMEHWHKILARARKRGKLIGVDERAYPRDYATFIRYNTELSNTIRARYPMPGYLTLQQLDEFLKESAADFPVQWIDDGHQRFGHLASADEMPTEAAAEER